MRNKVNQPALSVADFYTCQVVECSESGYHGTFYNTNMMHCYGADKCMPICVIFTTDEYGNRVMLAGFADGDLIVHLAYIMGQHPRTNLLYCRRVGDVLFTDSQVDKLTVIRDNFFLDKEPAPVVLRPRRSMAARATDSLFWMVPIVAVTLCYVGIELDNVPIVPFNWGSFATCAIRFALIYGLEWVKQYFNRNHINDEIGMYVWPALHSSWIALATFYATHAAIAHLGRVKIEWVPYVYLEFAVVVAEYLGLWGM